ncbi:MAG TPA: tetratricopeptide repeat protein, partial [Legionellaceae bacterium]|nr:tetratricopeptide repeat protein [Legionellaceae bacterium]
GKIELFQNHNPEEALVWFKKAANANDTSAQMYCAGAYMFGYGTKKNPDEAKKYYIPAARAENSIAQHVLAVNFLGVKQIASQKLGLTWLEKAVALRDPEAQITLAHLYQKGQLVTQNNEQAKQLLEDAIAQGYVPALYQMGRFEQEKNQLQEAKNWYLKATDAHYLPAMVALADLFLDPKYEQYSVQQGFSWMLKAAQAGSIDAQHRVAIMYQKGQGVTADDIKAAEWEKTANDNQTRENAAAYAEQQMAAWLTHGKASTLKDTDYRLAGIETDWTNPSAVKENIYNLPPQMNQVSRKDIYQSEFKMIDPNDIPINQYYDAMIQAQENTTKEALVFPEYPIRMQNSDASAKNLLHAKRDGYDYLTHIASSEQHADYTQIFKQLLNQAILGDSTAQFDVAQMYQQGLGVNKSIEEAIKFYQMAAAQNDLPAEYQLGMLYLLGTDLKPDYKIAMDWLTDAAFKGNFYAQYALARIYDQGFLDEKGKEVIASNPEQALAMYQLAAANHYGLAQYRLAERMVRQKNTDVNMASLEVRRRTIRRLYQGAADYGVEEAKLPLAFYNAMDADQIKQAQAFTDAQQSAVAGSSDAAFLLGIMYDRGIATEVSREQAIHWYEQAENNPMSAFILGTYAAQGAGLSKNYEKARDYLQFAVNKDFSPANFNMAVLQEQQGHDFLPYLEKAVAQGLNRAGLQLADYYMSSASTDQQLKQAHDLYERFAKQGEQSAQLKLGYMYEQGIGVRPDYNQALTWYTAGAEQGYHKSQYLLGRLYQYGLVGKAPDYALAKQWYTLAHTKYAPAALAYGFIDEMVDDDYVHALNEYQQALDLGDTVAAYDLGLMYEKGKNQSVDFSKAKDFYMQAAQQGVIKAMVALGLVYAEEKKYDDALTWLNKAAAQNDADAEYQLGWLAEHDLIPQSSMAEALKHYQQAAAQDHAQAKLALAGLYKSGTKVEKNIQQAIAYYKQLAQEGYPEAQYQLAKFCLTGKTNNCTSQEAKSLLEKAQLSGHRNAAQLLRLYTAKSQDGVSYIESIVLSRR